MSARSKNYIFKDNDKGELQFVGDFEGLYQEEEDPWQQSAERSDIANYYRFSRRRLADYIGAIQCHRLLEVGCGVGHSTHQLSELSQRVFSGADISATAIKKAKNLYPDLNFYQFDMCAEFSKNEMKAIELFDCIILNQILWYVMHDMETVKINIIKQLRPQGYVLISTAFLNEQRYGREFFIGYQGFIDFLKKHWLQDFELVSHDYDASDTYEYHDGIICLKLL